MTRIEVIKLRLAAATAGPWKPQHRDRPHPGPIVAAIDKIHVLPSNPNVELAAPERDADLIANARADLSWAVETLERITTKVLNWGHTEDCPCYEDGLVNEDGERCDCGKGAILDILGIADWSPESPVESAEAGQ